MVMGQYEARSTVCCYQYQSRSRYLRILECDYRLNKNISHELKLGISRKSWYLETLRIHYLRLAGKSSVRRSVIVADFRRNPRLN